MRSVVLLIPLGGCFLNFGDDGTQTGTEVPDYCAESGRSVVDADVVVESLGFAPSELSDGASGSWTGPFTPTIGAVSDGTLVVQRGSGDVELVMFTMVTRFVEEDAVSDGAPDAPVDCLPKLEIPIVGSYATEDATFDEAMIASMVGTSPTDATFSVLVPLAVVAGTARPASFGPEDWPNEGLSVDATFDGAWSGSLTWQGWTDEAGEAFDTATGTGTVEPSGASELAGSFMTSR